MAHYCDRTNYPLEVFAGLIPRVMCSSKVAQAKKTDATANDSKVDLEGGEGGGWGDDFEDWEKKPAMQEKKVLLQNLDDFDGLAAPPTPKEDNEPGNVNGGSFVIQSTIARYDDGDEGWE